MRSLNDKIDSLVLDAVLFSKLNVNDTAALVSKYIGR